MPLKTRIQWNAGTACVSECVLKTLWRVGVCVSALLKPRGTKQNGRPLVRRRKTVAIAGRSYGGPSEKFVGGFGGNFQKLRPNFSEVAFMWRSPDARHFGATSEKIPPKTPTNFSEVAPEVRPAVHTAALRLTLGFLRLEGAPEELSP